MARTTDCGIAAARVKKAKEIEMRRLRKQSVKNLKIRNLANNQKNLATPHKRGAALSKAEKEVILYTYESFKSKYSAQNLNILLQKLNMFKFQIIILMQWISEN